MAKIMNSIKKNIPNIVTIMNLISGCVAVVLASRQSFGLAFLFILLGAFFDFFDGVLARLLKTSSEIGKQLDSFADLTSFGIAPALICFYLFEHIIHGLAFIILLLPAIVAFRLSKFNITESNQKTFSGMPSPIVGILFASLRYTILSNEFLQSPSVSILMLVVLFSLLLSSFVMLSNVTYTKLKLSNKYHIIILIVSVILLYYFSTIVLLPIYIFYLLSPIVIKHA